MNQFIKTQITNLLLSLKNFEDSLKIAALEDDGQISKDEQKILDKVHKATLKYSKELEKLTN